MKTLIKPNGKLKFILKASKELGITAYEFGKNTGISSVGIHDILTGKSKNPRTRNLNSMLEYINTKYNTQYNKSLSNDPTPEAIISIEDAIFNAVHKRLKPILDKQANDIEALREDLKKLKNLK